MTARSRARDEAMMRHALAQAAQGRGRTHPNPAVGAVVFRGDRVLGRGFTKPPGGAHAEVAAIADARRRHGPRAVAGASLAVTLEPCTFQGRTGPCTEALLEAGIGRLVGGCRDPHPRVAGRGFARLRRRGVEVVTGVLEEDCRWQHRGFFCVVEHGRPWVSLKLATTLDGRIATASGESRWITGEASRAFVHRLRDQSDAVMVGSGTALVDDPELTVRRGERIRREPIRVLVDGRLRVPLSARLYAALDPERTWVLCRQGARGLAARRERAGQLIELPEAADGKVDLRRGLRALGQAGLTQLLVEGGGGLAAALLRSELVDEVHWMVAPKLIGGDGRAGLGPLGLDRLADAVALDSLRTRRRGEDLHLHGLVRRGKNRSAARKREARRSRKQ